MIQLGNKVFSLKGKVLFNISGRIRIKYQGIRYISDEFDTLLREISDIYYVEQVQINSVTETILIKYNEFNSIDMISEIENQ